MLMSLQNYNTQIFDRQLKMNESVWNLSLTQLLRQPGNNIFAIALSKSRNQIMTVELAELLSTAVQNDGAKWLQVVARLLRNNYETGFQCAIHDPRLLQPIISIYFQQPRHSPNNAHYHAIIIKSLIDRICMFNNNEQTLSINVRMQKMLAIRCLCLYLQQCLKHKQLPYLYQFFSIVCSSSSNIRNMLIWGDSQLRDQQLHQSQIQLICCISQSILVLQQQSVRQLKLTKFNELVSQPTMGNSISIKQVINQNLLNIIQLINNMNHQNGKLADYNVNLYRIVVNVLSSALMEECILGNNQLIQAFLYMAVNKEILKLNNVTDVSAQLDSLTDQISTHTYSDTVTGLHLTMLVKLLENSPIFFVSFTKPLVSGMRNSRDSLYTFMDTLLKVLILGDSNVIQRRNQQVQAIVEQVLEVIGADYENYADAQKLQAIRLFIVFIGKTLLNHKFNQSSQAILSKCISLCFTLIHNPENSSLQHQSIQILHLLVHNTSFRPILLHLLPQLLTHFLTINSPSIHTLQLLQSYLIQLPQLIQRSSVIILDYCASVFVEEVRKIQAMQARRVKGSLGIVRVLAVLAVIVEKCVQLGFDDIQALIVQPILSKLLTPHQIQYSEQLLSILNMLLNKHSHLSPSTLQLLSKLPILYQQNNKKLSIITPFLSTFVTNSYIKKEIVYEYNDLVGMILGLIQDYSGNGLSNQEWLYYSDEIRLLIWSIIGFFSQIVPDSATNDHWKMIANICENTVAQIKQLQKIINARAATGITQRQSPQTKSYLQFHELLIQLSIATVHILVNPCSKDNNMIPSAYYCAVVSIVKQTPIQTYSYYETLKMIPILLIQRTLVMQDDNYDTVIKDLVNFCQCVAKMGMQWGMGKNWGTITGVNTWTTWPWALRIYIQSVLKQLVTRRCIDKVDYMAYIEQIHSVLRT